MKTELKGFNNKFRILGGFFTILFLIIINVNCSPRGFNVNTQAIDPSSNANSLSSIENKVFGGQDPGSINLGKMEGINPSNGVKFYCTVVPVGPKDFVTAAHCFDSFATKIDYIKINMPQAITSEDGTQTKNTFTFSDIEFYLVHPSYTPLKYDNDIAFIKLKSFTDKKLNYTLKSYFNLSSVKFKNITSLENLTDKSIASAFLDKFNTSASTHPIYDVFLNLIVDLNDSKKLMTPHSSYKLAGYGPEDINTDPNNYTLKAIDVNMFGKIKQMSVLLVKPTDHNTGICHGDSGGAIYDSSQKTLYGLVSFSTLDNNNASPISNNCFNKGEFIVDINAFSNWIRGLIRIKNNPTKLVCDSGFTGSIKYNSTDLNLSNPYWDCNKTTYQLLQIKITGNQIELPYRLNDNLNQSVALQTHQLNNCTNPNDPSTCRTQTITDWQTINATSGLTSYANQMIQDYLNGIMAQYLKNENFYINERFTENNIDIQRSFNPNYSAANNEPLKLCYDQNKDSNAIVPVYNYITNSNVNEVNCKGDLEFTLSQTINEYYFDKSNQRTEVSIKNSTYVIPSK